jgi:hypothetical protein
MATYTVRRPWMVDREWRRRRSADRGWRRRRSWPGTFPPGSRRQAPQPHLCPGNPTGKVGRKLRRLMRGGEFNR